MVNLVKETVMVLPLSVQAIEWTKAWFRTNGRETAVIGISGGKDSAVVAGICVRALGPGNVVGVLMPNGEQADIEDSWQVVRELGIESRFVDIGPMYEAAMASIGNACPVTDEAAINIAPRLRMTVLYTIAQSISGPDGRKACVVGTGNMAERMVGYTTKGGDDRCDVNPIGGLWVDEVIRIGDELGYYPGVVHKAPSDGLCGKTDEDRLGFAYDQVRMAFTGHEAELPADILERIMRAHRMSAHKRDPIPMFVPVRGCGN